MTNCAETARTPDEQRLVDVASILAAGILRLRDRQSLPVAKQAKKPGDSVADRARYKTTDQGFDRQNPGAKQQSSN